MSEVGDSDRAVGPSAWRETCQQSVRSGGRRAPLTVTVDAVVGIPSLGNAMSARAVSATARSMSGFLVMGQCQGAILIAQVVTKGNDAGEGKGGALAGFGAHWHGQSGDAESQKRSNDRDTHGGGFVSIERGFKQGVERREWWTALKRVVKGSYGDEHVSRPVEGAREQKATGKNGQLKTS